MMSREFNQSDYYAYSAMDVAKILVRDPNQITDLPTYDYICENYSQNRAFEDLSHDEMAALLSVEAAVEDLRWLGFSNSTIKIFLDVFHEAYQELDLPREMPDIGVITLSENFYLAAYSVMAFPYGPPIVLTVPSYALKNHGFSITKTNLLMDKLTNIVAQKLTERREAWPYLLTVLSNNSPVSHAHGLSQP
ncbi:MAG: hypothetical protein ACK4VI_08850 [Alphaproteobacteria bacterium]